jgi:hypothetical protein
MMQTRSIVVPANAGTHNHQTEFSTLTAPPAKATQIVLNKNLHGVWVPAFAGTTMENEA